MTWTPWRETGPGCRVKSFKIPPMDYDDCGDGSFPFPDNATNEITHTVVRCGYTSRVPIIKVPNAFWATDGLWGGDQQTADAADDVAVLKESRVRVEGSYMYRGLADVVHLMSFDHCGSFNHYNMYEASLVEAVVSKTLASRLPALTFTAKSLTACYAFLSAARYDHSIVSTMPRAVLRHVVAIVRDLAARILVLSYDTESG